MARDTIPFVFKIVVPYEDVEQVQADLRHLAERVRTSLPDAAVVVVSARLGVSVFTAQGDALDLTTLPWDAVDALTALLGTGCWTLPGPGIRGSEVKAAWIAKRQA